nr:nucleotide-binding alpha-beta plait domain-containing protein [Tanacetum cinerariifolium]
RSKLGKRFGFVRFIKILDVVRLVNNLCTIWIGKFKLHVNIARFNRPLLNKGSHLFNPRANVKPALDASYKKVESRPSSSYIQAAKALKPALVLDDSCTHEPDLALSLVGKLKEFGSLPNLNKILVEEGFPDITIRYLGGGLWVILQFSLKISKNNFMLHVGVNSWFSMIQQASNSFSVDERVVWIDVEGFTPCDRPQVNSNLDHINQTKVLEKEPGAKASFQKDVNVLGCSRHFQSVKAPKSRGSILHIIEDFIKVGQTIGYKMEGCINDFEEIVSSQGVREFFK